MPSTGGSFQMVFMSLPPGPAPRRPLIRESSPKGRDGSGLWEIGPFGLARGSPNGPDRAGYLSETALQ
ncbi:hypothetical protein NSZ01_14370 [Nocardioides szechwanensis]|nr:hypothetical protein NSZ01_14370 [Nocardioides szechwanensis]